MTDMKSLLGSAFDHEPPLGFGREELLRKGRVRRIRRQAVVMGGAAMGMAVVLFGATMLNAWGGAAVPAAVPAAVGDTALSAAVAPTPPEACVGGEVTPQGTCQVDREADYKTFDAIARYVTEASGRGGYAVTDLQRAEPETSKWRTMVYQMTKKGAPIGELAFTRGEKDGDGLKPLCGDTGCGTRVEKIRGVDTEVVVKETPSGTDGKPSTTVFVRDAQGIQFRIEFAAEPANQPVFTLDELVMMMTVSVI